MLVLSRKSGESVVIGGDDGLHRLLKVKVVDITGGRVRLGFEVDTTVPILREELVAKPRTEHRSPRPRTRVAALR